MVPKKNFLSFLSPHIKQVAEIALILFLCFIASIFLSDFAFHNTSIAYAQEMGIVKSRAILHETASKSSGSLATLWSGDRVLLYSAEGGWYKVSYGNHTGYMMEEYIQPGSHSMIANSAAIASLGTAPGAMGIGDRGEDVSKLQQALKLLDYFTGPVDGEYSHETTAAVLHFQKDNGFVANGVADGDTVKALFGSAGGGNAVSANHPRPAAPAASSGDITVTASFSVSSVSVFADVPDPQ